MKKIDTFNTMILFSQEIVQSGNKNFLDYLRILFYILIKLYSMKNKVIMTIFIIIKKEKRKIFENIICSTYKLF